MFHTEELQKIIDQLQHAQVDGIGYFDTLLLILKLIALCAKPILFVICLILIFDHSATKTIGQYMEIFKNYQVSMRLNPISKNNCTKRYSH